MPNPGRRASATPPPSPCAIRDGAAQLAFVSVVEHLLPVEGGEHIGHAPGRFDEREVSWPTP